MSEALSAEISLATHEAYQNLLALMSAIDNGEKALESMGEAVKSADGRIGGLTAALNAAEEQFKSTGSEADKTKMEELRTSVNDAKQRAVEMKTEYGALEGQLSKVGMQSKKTADDTKMANAGVVESSKQVGVAAEDAGEKGANAGKKIDVEGQKAERAVKKLGDSFLGIGTSLFSLREAAAIIKEIEAHAKEVVKARGDIGDVKTDYDEKIKAIITNAGLSPGLTGNERARKLAEALQARAPGTATDVTAEILAKASATGYKIADPNRPDLDTKAPAFDLAAEVAKFAARQRLNPETAGKLFNMAQIDHVSDLRGMQAMLAQIEGAFHEIAITNPQEGMNAAIRASVGRMVQGVQLPQALASIAASSVGTTDPARAATNVEQFARVAMGVSDPHRLAIAKMARERGFISDKDVRAAMSEVAGEVGADHTDSIRSTREAIAREQAQMARRVRERGDSAMDLGERRTDYTAESDKIAKEMRDPRNARRIDELKETQRKVTFAWEKFQREAAEKLSDSKRQDTEANQSIKDAEGKIKELQGKDAQKLADAALQHVYSSLPLAAQEEMIWKLSEGMGEGALKDFAGRISDGRMRQEIAKQLGPAAREARNRALAAAGRPDVGQFRADTEAYMRTNTLARKAAAGTGAIRSGMDADAAGIGFYNNIFEKQGESKNSLVDQDIVELQSKGEGATGQLAAFYDQTTNAGTIEALRARRGMMIAWDQWKFFLNTSPPETVKKFRGAIAQREAKFQETWKEVFQPEGIEQSGADKLFNAQEAIAMLGELIEMMQRSDLTDKKTPGKVGEGVLRLPALRQNFGKGNLAPFPEGPAAPTRANGPRSDAGSGGGFGTGGGSRGVLDDPGGSGLASAGPTYNISVGTLVSQGGDDLDLPGRLGVPDLS